MSGMAGNHTQAAGDVLAVGEGDRCNCVNHAGAYSAIGACACPLHGMKALRTEVERLRAALEAIANQSHEMRPGERWEHWRTMARVALSSGVSGDQP